MKPVFMIPLTLEKLCAFYISKMQKNRCIIKGLSIYLFFFFGKFLTFKHLHAQKVNHFLDEIIHEICFCC